MEPTSKAAGLVLDALGNQTRRDILAILRGQPMTVGLIAERLPVSRPAVSRHLRILQQAGLVAFDQRGRRNLFYLQPAGFRDVQSYLDQFWDEALVSLKRLVEEQEGAQ